MEFFVELIYSSQQLTTFAKSFILDVWVGSECAFAVVSDEHQYQYGIEDFQQKIGGWNPKSGKDHNNHGEDG